MAKKANNELEKTSTEVKYEFNDKELKDLANQLSQTLQKSRETEGELKNLKNQYKTKLENLESEITIINEKYTQQYEMRKTPCYLFRNYATGKRQFLSALDKTDILKEEPLTAEDHQYKMNMDAEED